MNKDKIARPARGRFFPVTVAETVKFLHDLEFAAPSYLKRLNISFQNPDAESTHGNDVAALYPADEVIIYSVPEDFDRQRAKVILEAAFRDFAEIGKDVKPTDRRQKSISFRAYFAQPVKLIVTKRTRRATQAKYRGGAKFSNAFKPKGIKTDEQIVHSLDLT